MAGLGLSPGDRWPTDEEIAGVEAHIAKRRRDTGFMERLERRAEESLPVLEALGDDRRPVRLRRRAVAWAKRTARRASALARRRIGAKP